MIGLPFNRGAKDGIQNAALDSYAWINIRENDADPGLTAVNLGSGSFGFTGEHPTNKYPYALDISGCSSICIGADILLDGVGVTSFDIIPVFVDETNFNTQDLVLGGPGYAFLGTPDWTLSGNDSILTIRKTIFRIPVAMTGIPRVWQFPAPNAKWMMIYGNSNGGTCSFSLVAVGRGFNSGVGIVPMV